MRLLLFALCLSALGVGSYAVLTRAPAALRPERAPEPAAPPVAAPPGDVRQPARVVQTAKPPPAPRSLPSPAARARSRPVVRTRVVSESYPVEGATAAEVLSSMTARGPRSDGETFFGLTVAEIGLRYHTAALAGGCALTDVEVDLSLTVTLPDWAPGPSADPALVGSWGRFRRALAAHEGRHREIAEAGAQSMAGALGGLRRDSCPAVEAEAHRRLTRLEGDLAAAQRRYDAETDHGRTEGAVWPQ